MKKLLVVLFSVIVLFLIGNKLIRKVNVNPGYEVGQKIDSLNNVFVYYNGGTGTVVSRNVTDGYNVGLKYQCVEFIKRYYFEHFNHKMPNSYGHAIDFYNPELKDGTFNKDRALYQFSNPSATRPRVGDIIVMDKTKSNKFGHIAIISKVDSREIELIQQNAGPFSPTRIKMKLRKGRGGKWRIRHYRVLGWLSREKVDKKELNSSK